MGITGYHLWTRTNSVPNQKMQDGDGHPQKSFLTHTVHAMGNSGDELYSVYSKYSYTGLRNDGGSSWILYDKGW